MKLKFFFASSGSFQLQVQTRLLTVCQASPRLLQVTKPDLLSVFVVLVSFETIFLTIKK